MKVATARRGCFWCAAPFLNLEPLSENFFHMFTIYGQNTENPETELCIQWFIYYEPNSDNKSPLWF